MEKLKTDWARYEEGLRKRGSITFWVSDDVIDGWMGKPNGKKVEI